MSGEQSFSAPKGGIYDFVAVADAARWQRVIIVLDGGKIVDEHTKENTHRKKKKFVERSIAANQGDTFTVKFRNSRDKGDTWDESKVKIKEEVGTKLVIASEDDTDKDFNDLVVTVTFPD